MPAPYRDGRCTAFAQLGPGADVIRAITSSPQSEKIELKKVEAAGRKVRHRIRTSQAGGGDEVIPPGGAWM